MMSSIGTQIYGYCGGQFGRDNYDNKIIVAEGSTWVTAVCCDKYSRLYKKAYTANFRSQEEKQEDIDEWSKEQE